MNQDIQKTDKKGIDAAKAVVLSTTGIAVLSTVAIGVAGFLIWRNREQILSFVSKYVDLPESLTSEDSEDSLTRSKSANLGKTQYNSQSTTAHRM